MIANSGDNPKIVKFLHQVWFHDQHFEPVVLHWEAPALIQYGSSR